jgi:type IV secretion system protein VirD4
MALLALVFVVLLFAATAERHRKERVAEANKPFNPAQVLGRAGFATDKQLKKLGYFRKGGIRIGLSPSGKHALYYHGKGHILITAAARAGKLYTLLAALIFSLGKRSLVVFDAKGEITCVTGRARQRYGEVYVLNPFGIHLDYMKGLKQARYNPMDILNPNSLSFYSDCDKITDGFRPHDMGNRESHWWNSAAILISGLIAAIAKYGHPDDKNLTSVRAVITGSLGKTVFEFCRECMAIDDPYIKQKLSRFTAADAEQNKEFSGIVSTADTQTAFISGAIAENMKHSDFRFRDLKRKPGMTVNICLPLNKFDVCNRWFSTLHACMLAELLDETGGAPVLAIIDEASQIGYLKALEDAYGMAAGACGLQILAIYQSVSQIVNQFSNTWNNIIQNSGIKMFFWCRDHISRQTVSDLSGVMEVITQSRNVSIDPRTGEPNVSLSAGQTSRPVLHPQEVDCLPDDKMWLFAEGIPDVVQATRKPYTGEFRGDPNPYFNGGGFWSSLWK